MKELSDNNVCHWQKEYKDGLWHTECGNSWGKGKFTYCPDCGKKVCEIINHHLKEYGTDCECGQCDTCKISLKDYIIGRLARMYLYVNNDVFDDEDVKKIINRVSMQYLAKDDER